MSEPERLRRASSRHAVAVGATLLAVLATGACGSARSPAQLDATFVASAQSESRTVPADAVGQATLVQAARKLCDRRENHATVAERRATRLTSNELAAVARTFADARRFTALAMDTYCPS